MVKKAFFALVLEDMKENQSMYDPKVVEILSKHNFEFNSETLKIVQSSELYNKQWQDQCERSLKLATMLGNIYTGSLYNGLISLICDKTINLSGKRVMLFSYGSGCAASMFSVKFKSNYMDHAIYKGT